MKYEVAIKGRFRKKRVVLGYVDLDEKNVEKALNALGWKFYEQRLQRLFINDSGDLIVADHISLKKIKDA